MRAELWGSADFLAQYPQLAQLVATAYVRAHQIASVDNGRDAYIQAEAAAGQPESVVRRELDGDTRPWKARWSPLLTAEVKAHYAAEALYARQSGLIAKPLDTSTLYAPQFVDQALAQLKLQQYWAP